MMTSRDILFRTASGLAAAMLLTGCAAMAASTEQPATLPLRSASSASAPSAPSPSGRLLVMLTPAAAATMQRSRNAGHALTGIASLDALCAQYGITAITPLLPTPIDSDAIRARYPQRSRRAPATASTPDLSRTYVLQVEASHPIADAVSAFAHDPNIEQAQPDYQATTQSP